MLWITLVLLVVGKSVAQKSFWLRCPAIATVPDFCVEEFMGTWYEYSKYPGDSEIPNKCVHSTYSALENGSFKMIITQTSLEGGEPRSTEQSATPINDFHDGKFKIIQTNRPYWVIAVNYTSWAVVWGCTDDDTNSLRTASVLTRARRPSNGVIEEAYVVLDEEGLDKNLFRRIDQINCP